VTLNLVDFWPKECYHNALKYEGVMSIDKKTVEHVAHLARIELSCEELDKLSRQLEHILGFIDKLATLDTQKISPTNHILPVSNILREDAPRESLPIEKTLSNSPKKQDSFFVVPKVIE
jgi:aspartyl-tRNA(Asn)/glutamyl-tRNA(Gln) amidotransferase subunit C